MTKKVVITRPEHDITTLYLSSWSMKALSGVKPREAIVFDLHRQRASRKETEITLRTQKPGLVIINGHGNEKSIAGHNNELLITAGDNDGLLKGKIAYAVSCKSAKTLGRKSIASGAAAYLGYDDDFIFFYDQKATKNPLQDKTAALFLEPSASLIQSLVEGNTTGTASAASKQSFQDSMKKLLSSNATPEETSMARYLWWDLRHQACLGNKEARF